MSRPATVTVIIWALCLFGFANFFLVKHHGEQLFVANNIKYNKYLDQNEKNRPLSNLNHKIKNNKNLDQNEKNRTLSNLNDDLSKTPEISNHEVDPENLIIIQSSVKYPKQEQPQIKDQQESVDNIDDIIDPMIRRADAKLIKDMVPILCNTTKGELQVEVFPESWGTLGAQRFLELVDAGLFSTNVALTRAVKGFIIQFGTPGDPAWSAAHKGKFPALRDDKQWMPVGPSCGNKIKLHQNKCKRHRKGFLSFAGGGPNSRRIEMFVSLADTGHGGPPHEVPFGRVMPSSFPVLDQLYTGYGEMKNFGGNAPPSGRISKEGIGFLHKEYPLLDYITGCSRI